MNITENKRYKNTVQTFLHINEHKIIFLDKNHLLAIEKPSFSSLLSLRNVSWFKRVHFYQNYTL